MFYKKTVAEKTKLENAIDELLSEMAGVNGDTNEYAKMADQLEKLYKLKAIDKPEHVSPDTLALIAGNLAGIILIVGYERANVVTSKALSFIRQAR